MLGRAGAGGCVRGAKGAETPRAEKEQGKAAGWAGEQDRGAVREPPGGLALAANVPLFMWLALLLPTCT